MLSSISTALNSQKSPLLRLPGELRNQIYEYVIGGSEFYSYKDGPNSLHFRLCAKPYGEPTQESHANWSNLFSLSISCKQLLKETSHLPWSLNIFQVGLGPEFDNFLAQLDDKHKQLIAMVSFGLKVLVSPELARWMTEYTVPAGLEDCTGLTTVIHIVTLNATEKEVVKDSADDRALEVIDDTEAIQYTSYCDEGYYEEFNDDTEEEDGMWDGIGMSRTEG